VDQDENNGSITNREATLSAARHGGVLCIPESVDPMKIVMLCEFYDEKLQYQENLLAKYYAKHGHEVTVLASTFNSVHDYIAHRYNRRDPAREYRDGQVKVIKLPFSLNLLNRLRKFGDVGELLTGEKPDLIFAHDIHLNIAEAAAYKQSHPGCRIIMDYHADYTNSAKNWLSLTILHKLIRKRFLHKHLKYIDKIYPVVPMGAVFLNEVYEIARDEMELLPLGADTDLARSTLAEGAREAVRRSLEIPSDALVVFTGGKLAPLKKTHIVLDAFLEVADPNLHLLVVGDGDRSYMGQLLRRSDGHPRVHFVGWLDSEDVYRHMGACDFAVFPGSQSVLWQQALSMGLPLIVADGTHRGAQDPSYLNLYDNMVIVAQEKVTSDVIAGEIRQFASDRVALQRRRASALQASDELLNYDKLVAKTLRFD
jgi:1,2-diacylglycerol 3-alpha-glucosyltransferase